MTTDHDNTYLNDIYLFSSFQDSHIIFRLQNIFRYTYIIYPTVGLPGITLVTETNYILKNPQRNQKSVKITSVRNIYHAITTSMHL